MPEISATSEDTRIYEWCILYPYLLGQKEEREFFKEVEDLFSEVGATMVAKDLWGRRGLAYPVKGAKEGCFVIYHFEMDPSKVREVDLALRIMKGVLRHMFLKPPKHYQILKFSEKYEQWLKERETTEEVKTREQEEKVQEQVARKAKRQAKLATERKKVKEPALEAEDLTQKIEELISDDSLHNL